MNTTIVIYPLEPKQASEKRAAAKSTRDSAAKKASTGKMAAKPVRKSASARTAKAVIGVDGTRLVVNTVNADSPHFSDELSHAFRQSVARARKRNKELLR